MQLSRSFLLSCSLALTWKRAGTIEQIIVAVLLENFVSSMNKHDTFKRISEEAREHHKYAGALDPLLATLANFNSPQVCEQGFAGWLCSRVG